MCISLSYIQIWTCRLIPRLFFTGWKAQYIYIYMKVKDAQPNNIWNFNRFLAQLSPTERSKVYKDMISQDRAKLSVVFNRAI